MTRRADILGQFRTRGNRKPVHQRPYKMDIAPGEMIKVETRRGIIELKARADRDVPEGWSSIPFCYSEAAANILTNAALDPTRENTRIQILRCENREILHRNHEVETKISNRSRKSGNVASSDRPDVRMRAAQVGNMSANKHIERFLRTNSVEHVQVFRPETSTGTSYSKRDFSQCNWLTQVTNAAHLRRICIGLAE